MMTKAAMVFPRMQSMSSTAQTSVQTQIDTARKTEADAACNFAFFRQSLEDQSENDEKALVQPETQNDELCAKLASEKSDLNEYPEFF